jgi:hypothetical protein
VDQRPRRSKKPGNRSSKPQGRVTVASAYKAF